MTKHIRIGLAFSLKAAQLDQIFGYDAIKVLHK